MVRTYEPSAHSDRAPLELMTPKKPWYNKFVSDTAWRVYITTLLVTNILLSLAVIGSLQQVYISVNTLTEFVGNTLMHPPIFKDQVPPKAIPEKKLNKKTIPQSLDLIPGYNKPTPLPTTPTYETDDDINYSYYVVKASRL